MATTIEQQTVLDESLVPSMQRLRIRRSNFRLPSDIQSKEATLQVVYDVLRNYPLFRAFQVIADVLEIYMQEFWATAKLHHNSIRFKIDTRKSVLDLEAFREMLHISPRIPNQPFADLPTEEEILDFLKFLGHSHDIRYLMDVLVEAYEANKAILDTYRDFTILKRRREDDDQEGPSAGPNRGDLARKTDARSSFNELLDTPIDFSNFIMHRLNVDTLTPDLLAGPTYELMRGSCTSLTELEYHLEEPLPLIPDNRGRQVIPFGHFINNDLEYLRGGSSSRKYTTSITKTKAADYGHIKWIEDLVPREMWIQQPIDYNKHALWGVSHWGRKRKQFYGYAVNRESARDVYSKRRIIAVTELQILEWHDYMLKTKIRIF
nr:hypothetical protein [Tanacetum cinerariifolium]